MVSWRGLLVPLWGTKQAAWWVVYATASKGSRAFQTAPQLTLGLFSLPDYFLNNPRLPEHPRSTASRSWR